MILMIKQLGYLILYLIGFVVHYTTKPFIYLHETTADLSNYSADKIEQIKIQYIINKSKDD